jgi:hypothetical protein
MISYWQADGNANDSIGTNNGTLMNGTTFAPGKIGQAFSFRGDSYQDYVDIGNPTSLQLSSNVGTIETWIKTTADGQNIIVGKDNFLTDTNGYTFDVYNGSLMGELADASNYNLVWGNSTSVNDGAWHHVAMTWDGSAMILYVDGSIDGTASQTLTPVSNVYDLTIGYAQARSDFYFEGLIDEVEIYGRALSS